MAWITTKSGKRINTDWFDKDQQEKEKQIEQNKTEADKRNNKLPKVLALPNISADVANKTSKIKNLRTGEKYRFVKGTEIRFVRVFAGKGCSTVFRNAQKYAERYKNTNNNNPEDWQHCSGMALITNGKQTLKREVHWVQGKDGKIREAFIKFHDKQGE